MYYPFISETTRKMFSKSTANDVANDIALRLLEKDNDTLNRLHGSNEMRKYLYTVVRNEFINPKSNCNKAYRTIDTIKIDLDECEDIDLSSLVSVLSPYELKLITIYSQTNNVQELSRKYKIRRGTLYKDIKEIQLKIKQSIK